MVPALTRVGRLRVVLLNLLLRAVVLAAGVSVVAYLLSVSGSGSLSEGTRTCCHLLSSTSMCDNLTPSSPISARMIPTGRLLLSRAGTITLRAPLASPLRLPHGVMRTSTWTISDVAPLVMVVITRRELWVMSRSSAASYGSFYRDGPLHIVCT